MGDQTRVRALALFVAAVLGLGIGASCESVTYPAIAFRCDPRSPDSCPEDFVCCSDDPAAVGGALPDYAGRSTGGATPYFSGINNARSARGMCVNPAEVPAGAALVDPGAAGCPIPCNPTWDGGDIETVCGQGRRCCQTVQMQPEDCVFIDGAWRPATGDDIGVTAEGGGVLTSWGNEHRTHQDPNGAGCLGLAEGDMGSDAFEDCIRQLSVADQRGFCLALDPGELCPVEQQGYVDACEARNAGPGVGG